MTYELTLAQFSGPLNKLLELIEARQLEITEISLAQVTDDFLRYLETVKNVGTAAGGDPRENLRLIADFLAVASRLVFIKSKSLLPDIVISKEEEAEIRDLERRLLWYRAFKPAMRRLGDLFKQGEREFGRPYFLSVRGAGGQAAFLKVFYPGSRLTAPPLAAAMANLCEVIEQLISESHVVSGTLVSIEEKIKEIIAWFTTLTKTTFQNLSRAKSRSEAIVTFLAMLHLAREKIISLEQESHLSDIIIKKPETRSVPARGGSPPEAYSKGASTPGGDGASGARLGRKT